MATCGLVWALKQLFSLDQQPWRLCLFREDHASVCTRLPPWQRGHHSGQNRRPPERGKYSNDASQNTFLNPQPSLPGSPPLFCSSWGRRDELVVNGEGAFPERSGEQRSSFRAVAPPCQVKSRPGSPAQVKGLGLEALPTELRFTSLSLGLGYFGEGGIRAGHLPKGPCPPPKSPRGGKAVREPGKREAPLALQPGN